MTPERQLEKFVKEINSAFGKMQKQITELKADLERTNRRLSRLEAETAKVRSGG